MCMIICKKLSSAPQPVSQDLLLLAVFKVAALRLRRLWFGGILPGPPSRPGQGSPEPKNAPSSLTCAPINTGQACACTRTNCTTDNTRCMPCTTLLHLQAQNETKIYEKPMSRCQTALKFLGNTECCACAVVHLRIVHLSMVAWQANNESRVSSCAAESAEPPKSAKKSAQTGFFAQKTAPIVRPANGPHSIYQLYGWSQIRGPDSGPRTGAANFSMFRACWRPGAFFLQPQRTQMALLRGVSGSSRGPGL